jgi:hypothetical protein
LVEDYRFKEIEEGCGALGRPGPDVARHLGGRTPARVVYVPDRLFNLIL